MLLIKDLYELVSGLPEIINVIFEDKSHWIGSYEKAPEEIKMMQFKEASLSDWGSVKQVIFYM